MELYTSISQTLKTGALCLHMSLKERIYHRLFAVSRLRLQLLVGRISQPLNGNVDSMTKSCGIKNQSMLIVHISSTIRYLLGRKRNIQGLESLVCIENGHGIGGIDGRQVSRPCISRPCVSRPTPWFTYQYPPIWKIPFRSITFVLCNSNPNSKKLTPPFTTITS